MSHAIVNIGYATTGQLTVEENKNDEMNLSSGNSQTNPFYYGVMLTGFIFADPFLYYILETSDEKKCIVLDRNAAYYACAILTIYDIFYVVFCRRRLFKLWNNFQRESRDAVKTCSLLFNIFILLPVPQVMVLYYLFSKRMIGWTIWIPQIVLALQHIPRFFQFMFTTRRTLWGRETFPQWLSMFIFLYIISGQLYGALWYNGAVHTETECWEEACRNHTGCSIDIFSCNNSLENIKLLNDSCSRHTTSYDFELFLDAHDSGLLLSGTDYIRRSFFCFKWGLQNIISFGQSIEAVSSTLGNIFAIAIIFTGVVLFFFLVGKLQLCLQADTERLSKMRQKWEETEQWMPLKKLSQDNQYLVKNHRQESDVSQETKAINIENIFNGLPEIFRKKMIYELSIDQLKKVEQFGIFSEAELRVLHVCLKPVFFGQRTHIIRKGDQIDEMIFVVQGKLWTYTSRTNGRNCKTERLKDGDCWGKELVEWFNADPYTSDLPISTKTIQAVTDVDAFVLMAHDLKDILIKHHIVHLMQLRLRFRRELRLRRNAQRNSTLEASSSNMTQFL